MLRFIKNNLLWSQTFDAAFERGGTFFGPFVSNELQEKRFHWRERLGRLRGLTPEKAAFRAYEEFAEGYVAASRGQLEAERELQDLAFALEYAAPFTGKDGQYRDRKSFLSPFWLAHLEKYQVRRAGEKSEQERQTAEILSLRFEHNELDSAWAKLVAGDVPWQTRSVFEASRVRTTPHKIASQTGVEIRDVMFWLIVFRTHGLVEEAVVMDRHMYTGRFGFSDPTSEPHKSVVAGLR
ncbi:hypothetical protein AB4099_25590 [Bosea sp. 2KB_26]|uniref:hypothetical protein n=1 Tax=Bosea sp. 2KB_26 TaxID=3237475 RepID=UPI003F902BA3